MEQLDLLFEPPSPVRKPSESSCASQRARLLEVLENNESVSGLLIRQICPCSATQRISELRDQLERHGRTIECERIGSGSLYRIVPYQIKETT